MVRDSAVPWGGDWDESGHIYFTSNRAVTTRVPAGGGVAEAVSTLDSAKGVSEHDWARLLPGGKRLLVQNWHNSIADAELAVLDLATGEATPIIQGLYGRYIPTGHIVYATSTGSLMRVPFDPSAGKVTGAPLAIAEQVQIDGSSGSAQFSVSDNGTLAYMSGGGAGSAQVVWVDRSGKQTPVDSAWRGQFSDVALSPDNSHLAVAALGSDGEQIWVKRLPSGPLSRVSFKPGGASRPVWTADGRRVAFISAQAGGVRQGWVQRADGSAEAEVLLKTGRSVEGIDWMPDGKRFLARLGSTTGGRDIVLASEGDTAQRLLVSGPYDEFAPAVSPDGRWFAYVTGESGRNEIFVRRVDDPGAGRTQVSLTGGEEPRWAPTGKELYYRTRAGEMMAAEVTLGATFTATRSSGSWRMAGWPRCTWPRTSSTGARWPSRCSAPSWPRSSAASASCGRSPPPPASSTPTSCRCSTPAPPRGCCTTSCPTCEGETLRSNSTARSSSASRRRCGSPPRWLTRWITPTATGWSTGHQAGEHPAPRRAADGGRLRHRAGAEAAAGGRMTETGSVGTPHYMSPEQATAEKEITARSDQYSLASVVYEMLAGQPPHLGGSAQQIIMKIVTDTARPVTRNSGRRCRPTSRRPWPRRSRSDSAAPLSYLGSDEPGRLALTPDGRELVYTGGIAGKDRQLFVRPLGSLASRPIPGTSGLPLLPTVSLDS